MKIKQHPRLPIGHRRERLQVLGPAFWIPQLRSPSDRNRPHVVCQCDCGQIAVVAVNGLLAKRPVKSCGCAFSTRPQNLLLLKHGLGKHPLRSVRKSMIARCTDLRNSQYRNYGGRGITVCDEWMRGSETFIRWGIANGWQPGLQIDRRDNDKGYSPDNCRFVTARVNSNNRRAITRSGKYTLRPDITIEDVIALRNAGLTVNAIASQLGTSWHTVAMRIERATP